MFEVNGICYAGTPEAHVPVIDVVKAEPLADYKLKLLFSSGESKIFDMSPLLDGEVFHPLKDQSFFQQVKVKHGVPTWDNGNIDFDPETLYRQGTAI
jgi:hypothetical protein